jgi:hypothetical protein
MAAMTATLDDLGVVDRWLTGAHSAHDFVRAQLAGFPLGDQDVFAFASDPDGLLNVTSWTAVS